MKIAKELRFGDLPSYKYGIDTYDSTKLGLGQLMVQKNGATSEEKWAGPLPLSIIRTTEAGYNQSSYPWAMRWSSTIDYIFLIETSAAAVTRRLMLVQFNRITGDSSIVGQVTLTYPTATNHTVRGFRMTYDKHTAGTVAVSGTAVTGTSTTWLADGACVGNRIGFGSTDPAQITTWYTISAIGSNTGITLTSSAGTISAGTPYVIEDLRAITANSNATATNGGLYVTKGLSINDFIPTSTTIPAATTVDNIKAVYWLADAATVTNTNPSGVGIQERTSFSTHMCWVVDGTTTPKLFEYNLRAALTLTAGKATNAFSLATGNAPTLTGTPQQINNGRICVTAHGPGAGQECFYFTTATRIYRSVPMNTITSGMTTFFADNMVETPPGGTNTHGATSLMGSVEYSNTMDAFIISTNPTNRGRDWVTKYYTDASPIDRAFIADIYRFNGTVADSTAPTVFTKTTYLSNWIEGGILYSVHQSSTANQHYLYIHPIAADWNYNSSLNAFIVTPKVATSGAAKFYRTLVNEAQFVGGQNFGISPEPYRISYRTVGISDNSGSWTLVDQTGDISGLGSASEIQFKIEFRTIGPLAIPSRIFSVGVLYETETSLPDELRWNLGDTDNATGVIGVIQTNTFSTMTTFTITYRRSDTNAVVLVQSSSSSTNGVWEYWNGSAWVSGIGANSIGVRRRFRPTAGLPVGVDVYAKIEVA